MMKRHGGNTLDLSALSGVHVRGTDSGAVTIDASGIDTIVIRNCVFQTGEPAKWWQFARRYRDWRFRRLQHRLASGA